MYVWPGSYPMILLLVFGMLLFYQKLKAVERTKALLETASAHRLADIFVASFEGSFDQRLAMLDAVDLRQRLLKATEIITRHLQVCFALLDALFGVCVLLMDVCG
jgi:hypothetical protein